MLRASDYIIVALLLIGAGCLFWQTPEHPTIRPTGKRPLAFATSVPVLQAGSSLNLAAQVADFTSPGWNLEGVTLARGAAMAPDGSETAVRLRETSEHGRHRIETSVGGVSPGAIHTLSMFVKSAAPVQVEFEMRDVNPGKHGAAQFDLQESAVVRESGDVNDAGMEMLPDGWIRCWAAMPYSGSTAVFNFALLDSNGVHIYSGNNSVAPLIWGVRFEAR